MEGIDIYERLPQAPAAVPAARVALTPLEGAVNPGTFATLRLLVSELVGNSVRHGSEEANEDIELSIDASRDTIRVEVSDSGAGFSPLPRAADADMASGWGLHLLDALSDRWGTEQHARVCVWFELPGMFAAADPRRN